MNVALMRFALALLLAPTLLVIHVQASSDLPLMQQWAVLHNGAGSDYAELYFRDAALSRFVMAMLVGAALGLSGSLFQQALQNRLISPMTLGAGSGAWLALVAGAVWAPALAVAHGQWLAMTGAMAAVIIALSMAGRDAAYSSRVVLSGLTISLLLGAITTAVVLFNEHVTFSMFVWGAGDLAQIDWHNASWLVVQLWVIVPVLLLAGRSLTLLRLGGRAARGLGVHVGLTVWVLLIAAAWLCSIAITTVGLIGFIGLLAPNIARQCGARNAKNELCYSMLLGAVLLISTDIGAIWLSKWSSSLIPSGVVASLLGAPMMLWLVQRRMSSRGTFQHSVVAPSSVPRKWRNVGLLGAATILLACSLCAGPTLDGWRVNWPDAVTWSLRWPRTLTAVSAGAGLAIAGMLLQRLLRNPMASPDILGLSAGATLAVVASVSFAGVAIQSDSATAAALLGSLLVLVSLMLISQRHAGSPVIVALSGLSLSALLGAGLQAALAKGSADSFALLAWMAGSAYATSATQAIFLVGGVAVAAVVALLLNRSLTLISLGDELAKSLGLNNLHTRLTLMCIAACLCAMVTCSLGPITFLGLLAPHMALMLGARNVVSQLLLSALLGALLMLAADWLARVLIYPSSLPVGVVASVICGGYFMFLLKQQQGRQYA